MRFKSVLQQAIAQRAQQPNYLFAVLYVDLDRFAMVNNSLGRDVGNQLLGEVARRFRDSLRAGDIITRLREDEFLIFVDDIQQVANASQVVEKIGDTLHSAFRLSGQEVFISASVGIALGSHRYSKAEEIVRDAEVAMHHSKTKGPGSYEIFDPKLHEEAKMQMKLETELRGAIDLHQLRVQYEPIVSMETDRVAGFEALLRWSHPGRGMIYPGEFVPTAEKTGLIVPITQWVLQEACRQLKKWQEKIPAFSSVWVSVNLSPSYIEKCDFAQELITCADGSGVDASNLVFEITESQLLENADNILKGFTRLREKGTKLWIDDFGSGYSSLAYLVNFPIHSLKIDRSFISKLIHDDKSTTITKAIVSMGKSLGLHVIAEGVETQEQLDYLRSIGCPYVQGHYFSGSVDGETIESVYSGK